MQLTSYGPGSAWELSVRGPLVPRRDTRGVEMHVVAGRNGEVQNTYGVAGIAGGVPLLVFQLESRHSSPITVFVRGWAERRYPVLVHLDPAAEELVLEGEGMEPMTLATGPLEAVVQALTDCQDKLTAGWGFAGAEPSQPVRLLNPQDVNNVMYYPAPLLLNRVGAIVQVRVIVGADAKVRQCVVQAPSWGSDFERNTCQALRKMARFEPARVASGKPVDGLFRASTMFLMKAD